MILNSAIVLPKVTHNSAWVLKTASEQTAFGDLDLQDGPGCVCKSSLDNVETHPATSTLALGAKLGEGGVTYTTVPLVQINKIKKNT